MCRINCSGGCPQCSPEDHDPFVVKMCNELVAAEQRIAELVEWQTKAASLLEEGQRLAKKDGSSLWEVVDDFLSALNPEAESHVR